MCHSRRDRTGIKLSTNRTIFQFKMCHSVGQAPPSAPSVTTYILHPIPSRPRSLRPRRLRPPPQGSNTTRTRDGFSTEPLHEGLPSVCNDKTMAAASSARHPTGVQSTRELPNIVPCIRVVKASGSASYGCVRRVFKADTGRFKNTSRHRKPVTQRTTVYRSSFHA